MKSDEKIKPRKNDEPNKSSWKCSYNSDLA